MNHLQYTAKSHYLICNGIYVNYPKFVITSVKTIAPIPSNIGVMLVFGQDLR